MSGRKRNRYANYTIALAFAVVCSLVAMPVAAEPVEISFWSLFTGGDGQVMDALVERFNTEHPEIRVTHTILPWGDPYYSRLITSIVGGAPPAVAAMHDSRIKMYTRNHLLTPFTPDDLERMGISEADFVPNIWAWAQDGGLSYGIPLDIHPLALYMNVSMFEEAGIESRTPQSEEELIRFTRALTRDRDGDGVADIAGFAGFGAREWLGDLYQYGGRMLDEGGLPAFNSLAGQQALEVQRRVIGATDDRIFGWFGDQTAAMQLLGPWEIGNFTRLGINFATDLAPQLGPEQGTWAGSHLLVVPTGVKEQSPEVYDAALTFIAWLSDNTIEWSAGAGHVPARIDRITVEGFLQLEHQQAFARSLEFAQFWPDHRLEPEFHNQGIWPFLIGEIDAGTALNRLEQVFNNLMSEE